MARARYVRQNLPGAGQRPWGSETRIRSRGGAVVLVDQPTEQIPSANVARTDRHRATRLGSWRGEAEGAMGSAAVVVLDIGPKRSIEMPPTEGERPVEALGPDRLDHALGVGVGVRSLDGRHDHPGPFRANDLVERPAELRVPVADEEPDGTRASLEVYREIPGQLGDPRRLRVRCCGTQVDPPAPELDEHQDAERAEPGGLDGEEVAGHDPARLSPQELGPAWAGAPRGGTEARGPEQVPDRRRSDAEAELAKLTLDPHAALAGVLPGEAEDERTDRGIDPWPARATGLAVGPLPAHELALPPEQRRRGDEEGDPAVTRQDATRRREQDPVDQPQPRWARRPLQYPELVAENEGSRGPWLRLGLVGHR
jgi:hypothetical protein